MKRLAIEVGRRMTQGRIARRSSSLSEVFAHSERAIGLGRVRAGGGKTLTERGELYVQGLVQ